jgi:hypothetical protein
MELRPLFRARTHTRGARAPAHTREGISPATLTILTYGGDGRRIAILPKQVVDSAILGSNPDLTLTTTLTQPRPNSDSPREGPGKPPAPTWEQLAAQRWGPAIGDPEPGIGAVDRFTYRKVLPTWSLERRERCWNRANALAEQGVPFPEDERRAFREIVMELARTSPTPMPRRCPHCGQPLDLGGVDEP